MRENMFEKFRVQGKGHLSRKWHLEEYKIYKIKD